jgi:Ulp1 family protease
MSTASGLPLNDSRFDNIAFTEHGLRSLRDGEWLNDEVLDLFSILELSNSGDVYYIPSNTYATYKQESEERGVPVPNLFSERRHFQPERRSATMKSKKMWVATIADGGHWQTLCILNPGKQHCFAILLDSLIRPPQSNRPPNQPRNFGTCQNFATLVVDEVYGNDNLSITTKLPLHTGLVTNQPNGNDCGLYSLLSLHHARLRVTELTNIPSAEAIHDFRHWYSVSDASNLRVSLRDRYHRLLDSYGVPST